MAHVPLRLLSKARASAKTHSGSERFVEPDIEESYSAEAADAVLEGHIFSIGVAFSQVTLISVVYGSAVQFHLAVALEVLLEELLKCFLKSS